MLTVRRLINRGRNARSSVGADDARRLEHRRWRDRAEPSIVEPRSTVARVPDPSSRSSSGVSARSSAVMPEALAHGWCGATTTTSSSSSTTSDDRSAGAAGVSVNRRRQRRNGRGPSQQQSSPRSSAPTHPAQQPGGRATMRAAGVRRSSATLQRRGTPRVLEARRLLLRADGSFQHRNSQTEHHSACVGHRGP